jgi:RND family efflux transporter MFP subunit
MMTRTFRGSKTACVVACLALIPASPGSAQDGTNKGKPFETRESVVLDDTFDCVIEPQQTIKLSSPISGVIREVKVSRGDFVHKGQIVARLEAGVEEASLELARAKASSDYAIKSAQAKFEFLWRKHERTEELAAKKIVAEATFDENLANARMAKQEIIGAELNAGIARLEVKQAEAVVEQRVLRSPIDGIVTDVLLHPGEYRNDQSPVMTLAEIDPLRVEVFVPTARYNLVRAATSAEVQPEAPIGGVYEATVSVVDRVMDAASGTFGVRLRLPNADRQLPAGLKCKIRFLNVMASPAQTAAR